MTAQDLGFSNFTLRTEYNPPRFTIAEPFVIVDTIRVGEEIEGWDTLLEWAILN
jgi:hypothetical protein